MAVEAKGPTPALRAVRTALVAGYLGFILFGLISPWQPRVFWTMLLPLVPAAIVLLGFPVWRQICPLAWFGEAGRALNRGEQKKVPDWLQRWFFPVTFAILLSMLVLRLVATNGDRFWLSGLLVGLALAAALTNLVFTGKSWCNFLCPVGLVERVYTEPNSLRSNGNSQCVKCTACKKQCPDIDQENAYWKDLTAAGRRIAIYSFPGLVLAFYVYYWLRAGAWEAYFDGGWTRQPADAELAFGPGFFFAPGVPALVAATLTLIVFSLASYGLFRLMEGMCGRLVEDPERRRHLVMAVAAFAAFNLFYLFAGAPSLRQLPGGTRAVAFIAPLAGTLFLVKRWRRTQEHFVGDRGAARLLRSWPFDDPPPSDSAEVYGWIRASQHAREKDLEAYASTVREMIGDGLVRPSELRLLEGVRKQLGVSEREHEQILGRLTEEERDLFTEGTGAGVEVQAQLEGYQVALAEALLRGAAESEIEDLRRSFGVGEKRHQAVLHRIRGASGELLSRARRQLARALTLRRELGTIGATEPTAARVFLCYLLDNARSEALERVFDLLEAAGDGPMIQALRRKLTGAEPEEPSGALELLVEACPGAEELAKDLEVLVQQRPVEASERDPGGEVEILLRLLADVDPYLRAGAVWAAAEHPEETLREALAGARRDRHPLVRETAKGVVEERETAEGEGGKVAGERVSTIQTMHFLRTVPFFSELGPGNLWDLAQCAVEERVEPPRPLVEEDDPDSDALFVLIDGRATVTHTAEGNGGERLLGTLGPGGVVGELSVLDGKPRSATVRPVDGPLRFLRIPGQKLRDSLLRSPGAARSVLGKLVGHIRRLSE